MADHLTSLQMKRYARFVEQDASTGLFDLTFEIENKTLMVHRSIVLLCSGVLETLVSEQWNADARKPVKIDTFSYDNFKEFIIFLYKGSCEILRGNLQNFVMMSDVYNVPELLVFCDQITEQWDLTRSMALEFLELAWKFSMEKLVLRCVEVLFEHPDPTVALKKIDKNTSALAEELILRLRENVDPWAIFTFAIDWACMTATQQQIEPSAEKPGTSKAVDVFLKIYHPLALLVDFSLLKRDAVLLYAGQKLRFFDILRLDRVWQIAAPFLQLRVTNSLGKSIVGNLWRFDRAQEIMQSCHYKFQSRIFAEWKTAITAPPSTAMRIKKCVESSGRRIWYLLYNTTGDLLMKKIDDIEDDDFLICEMLEINDFFGFDWLCNIHFSEVGKV